MKRRKPAIPAGTSNFDSLPNAAMIDVRAVAMLRGVSIPTVWRWSRAGLMPKPEKTGPNSTRWQVGALRQAFAAMKDQATA